MYDDYRQLEDPWIYWAAPVTGRQTAHWKCCCEETVGRGQSDSADSLPPCIQPQSYLTAQWRSVVCAADSQKPASDQGVESASKVVVEPLSTHIKVHLTIFPGNTERSSKRWTNVHLTYYVTYLFCPLKQLVFSNVACHLTNQNLHRKNINGSRIQTAFTVHLKGLMMRWIISL